MFGATIISGVRGSPPGNKAQHGRVNGGHARRVKHGLQRGQVENLADARGFGVAFEDIDRGHRVRRGGVPRAKPQLGNVILGRSGACNLLLPE